MTSKLLTFALVALIAVAAEAARTNTLNGGLTTYTNVTSFQVITTNGVTNNVLTISAKQTTNAALDALAVNNGANLTNLPLGGKLTTNLANTGFLLDVSGTNLLWISTNGITNRVTVVPQ